MPLLRPFSLAGRSVRLEPLGREHVPGLLAAALDRGTYAYTWVPADERDLESYLARAFADRDTGVAVPFATIDARTEKVVGSTRFMALEYWTWPLANGLPDVAEVGSTWLAESAQRTSINTEAKLLMFTHAFEEWQVERLFLKTDARNERSRAAILRIGAQFEGVLRHSMPRYNEMAPRDSAYYSVVPEEWPAVKAKLIERLALG